MNKKEQHFTKIVWRHHTKHVRKLPWKPPSLKVHKDESLNPYKVLVSEIMLQQTQVDRVLPKYTAFIKKFPTFKALAKASLREVLSAWQGLGYNRRGLNVKRTAEIVMKEYDGKLPQERELLEALPGIGPYTAGALRAFIWNIPEVFIETNIRTVYLHHFFAKKKEVHDKDILKRIEKTLDTKNPRDWYYALMDYGTHLKQTHDNPNTKSKHYTKQSTFKGSNRELRGKILKLLTEKKSASYYDIFKKAIITKTDPQQEKRLQKVLNDLVSERLISHTKKCYAIL